MTFKGTMIVTTIAVGAAMGVTLTGCSDIELRKATQKFDETMSSSSTAIRSYYTSLNHNCREAYFVRLRFEPTELMSSYAREGEARRDTALKNLFKPEYINARMKVLEALTNYSHGLGLLAASDAPKQVREQLEQVGANIKQLEKDISALSESSPSSEIGAYAGFVTTLGGIVMEQILELKKDRAIRKYIEQGNEPTLKAFKLLNDDLNGIYNMYETNVHERLHYFAQYYNRNMTTTTNDPNAPKLVVDDKRLRFLSEAKTAAMDLAAVQDGDPANVIWKLCEAHQHLVECATKGCKSPDVIARVLDDFAEVLNNVNKVVEAVRVLRSETSKGST